MQGWENIKVGPFTCLDMKKILFRRIGVIFSFEINPRLIYTKVPSKMTKEQRSEVPVNCLILQNMMALILTPLVVMIDDDNDDGDDDDRYDESLMIMMTTMMMMMMVMTNLWFTAFNEMR